MEAAQRHIVGHLDRIHAHATERRLDHAQRAAETYAEREAQRPADDAGAAEGTEDDAGAGRPA